MIYLVLDAHNAAHTPKLIIENPDSFRITDVETIERPDLNFPKVMNNYTKIYFSYREDDYYVTDEPTWKVFDYRRPEEGYYILLYCKDNGNYKMLDHVFDSFTRLHHIKHRKHDLLIRLTDIKLLGGCAEPEVEQLHNDLEEIEKKRELLRKKLYP